MGQTTRRRTLCWWVEEELVRAPSDLCQPTGPIELPWAGNHCHGRMRAWSASWRACIPGHTGMWAHGVMSLHYNIGTHQSQPHTRSSDGVLVPHSAPRDAVVAPQHQTCSLRFTPPKLFWSSGPPRSPSPHSWHQRSDSEIDRCDGCNKIAASHLVSPSFSEQAHFLSHASVVLAQPACYFVARLLLPKRPTYT